MSVNSVMRISGGFDLTKDDKGNVIKQTTHNDDGSTTVIDFKYDDDGEITSKIESTNRPINASSTKPSTTVATNSISGGADCQSGQAKAIAARIILTDRAMKAALGGGISGFMEAGNFTEGLLSSGADKIYEEGKNRRERANAESKQILADADAHYRACMSSSSSSSSAHATNRNTLKDELAAAAKGDDSANIDDAMKAAKKLEIEAQAKKDKEKASEAEAIGAEIATAVKTETNNWKSGLDHLKAILGGQTYTESTETYTSTNKITSDNIMAIASKYNTIFGGNLFEDLMGDVHGPEGRALVQGTVGEALFAEAKKRGLESEAADAKAFIDFERKSGWSRDGKIADKYQELYDKIVNKEKELTEAPKTNEQDAKFVDEIATEHQKATRYNDLITVSRRKGLAGNGDYATVLDKADAAEKKEIQLKIDRLNAQKKKLDDLGLTDSKEYKALEASRDELQKKLDNYYTPFQANDAQETTPETLKIKIDLTNNNG